MLILNVINFILSDKQLCGVKLFYLRLLLRLGFYAKIMAP